MNKTINNVSLMLAFLAFVYALLFVPEVFELLRQPSTLADQHSANYIGSFLRRDILGLMRNTISGSGTLLGFAALIEIADRIRWQISRSDAARAPADR